MDNIIVFAILAAVILVAAIASVITTRIMRAVTALLFVLFAIAGMYFPGIHTSELHSSAYMQAA